MEKVEHYKIFWDNAETNCRLEKQPLPDEHDDGSFTGFDYSFYLLTNDFKLKFSTRLITIQLLPGRNQIRNQFINAKT